MALKGIKVVELAGLAPVPFCGMILSDFGASVTLVDRVGVDLGLNNLTRGKRSIALDISKKEGSNIFKRLSQKSDVLIEPYRPGIMEKLGLGPEILMAENPSLIYARLSGYGQTGPMSSKASHDINALAISGVLSMLGHAEQKPFPPVNILADFAGGGTLCALGICMALIHRFKTGEGQVVDSNLTDGAAYMSSFLWKTNFSPQMESIFWGRPRGKNLLDGGLARYQTYKTKDGKYMAVGALEPKFNSALFEGLGLNEEELSDIEDQDQLALIFSKEFESKTQAEWCAVFDKLDACVTPVLNLKEAHKYPHHAERGSYYTEPYPCPKPSPILSKCTIDTNPKNPKAGEQTQEILEDLGYSRNEISKLSEDGVIGFHVNSKL